MSGEYQPPKEGLEVSFGMRQHAIIEGVQIPCVVLKTFGTASLAIELSVPQAEGLVLKLNRAIKGAKKLGK